MNPKLFWLSGLTVFKKKRDKTPEWCAHLGDMRSDFSESVSIERWSLRLTFREQSKSLDSTTMTKRPAHYYVTGKYFSSFISAVFISVTGSCVAAWCSFWHSALSARVFCWNEVSLGNKECLRVKWLMLYLSTSGFSLSRSSFFLRRILLKWLSNSQNHQGRQSETTTNVFISLNWITLRWPACALSVWTLAVVVFWTRRWVRSPNCLKELSVMWSHS